MSDNSRNTNGQEPKTGLGEDATGHPDAEPTIGTGDGGEAGAGAKAEDELALEVEVEPADDSLEQRVAELEAQNKDLHDKYLRQVAETDNVRKRAKRDADDSRFDAQAKVLREMLPVIDNLERALAHATQTGSGDGGSGIIEGVQLVLRQFTHAFERLNVFLVEAEGKPFDPNLHEAVSQIETSDVPPGAVVAVMQNGYRMGERLLRPAMVAVAKAPPEEPAGPNGHDREAAGEEQA